MDSRALLAIETALTRRLWDSWRPMAGNIYRGVVERIADKDFAGAHDVARSVDLTPVVDENREWVKYHLLSAAFFGARKANPKGPLMLSAGSYETTLNKVADIFTTGIRYRTSLQLADSLTDVVAEAEMRDLDHKVDKRYLHSMTSFKDKGTYGLHLNSALHSSRLAVWGFTAEAEAVGVDTYRIDGVLDGRMCDFCLLINGREFAVSDARTRITNALNVDDPMALVDLQPWPDQSAASIDELGQLSNDELAARGYSVPPFHPWDRCYLTLVDSAKVQVPVGTQVPESLPDQTSTEDTFAEIGASLSPDEVGYWNENIGASPVQVLSQLTGQTPAEYMAQYGALPQFSISPDGVITFTQTGDLAGPGSDVEVMQSMDPITDTMVLRNLDMLGGSSTDAARFTQQTLNNSLNVVAAVGAAALVFYVSGGDSLYSTAINGYVPEDPDWVTVSLDIWDDIQPGGVLEHWFLELEPDQQRTVIDILNSPDPAAMLALVSLPYITSSGVSLAQILLYGRSANMRFDWNDPLQQDFLGNA